MQQKLSTQGYGADPAAAVNGRRITAPTSTTIYWFGSRRPVRLYFLKSYNQKIKFRGTF